MANGSYEESFAGFVAGLEQHFTLLLKESYKAPSTFVEHVKAFTAAVDWSEPWIRGLLLFHLACLLLALGLRKNVDAQSVLFFGLCALVYFAENINSLCHQHWRAFSRQDYFDRAGVFAGVMFSGPLIAVLLVQVVNFLYLAATSLVKVKRLELAERSRRDRSKEE